MTSTESTVFSSVHTLANYLHHIKPDISPIKLQKSLYFLFAYYGAIYGKQDEEGISEGSTKPKYLFDAEFEAWQYGPVIREVYRASKDFGYNFFPQKIHEAVEEVKSYPEVKQFIDELFTQIDSISDFTLVDRSHEDNSWKEAYQYNKPIKNDMIIAEYIEKYV